MSALVTVLIPAYNRELYIEECIRSVQMQSLKDLEILIIDDGSTDRTADLCQNMAQHDSRIRLIKGNHGGVSAARNIGLDAAKGKYIFFLDSDDVLNPMILETLVRGMEQYNVPISGSCGRAARENNWHRVREALQKADHLGTTQFRKFDDVIREIFKGGTPFGYIGGVMIRRDWVGETRFRTDLYIGEDFYFIYENLIKGADALYLNELWYYVRLHTTNLHDHYDYDAFMNRLLRRELVWKNEDASGRPDNSAIQKREVFGSYITSIKSTAVSNADKNKMRKQLRVYRKELLPALSFKKSCCFCCWLMFPLHRVSSLR